MPITVAALRPIIDALDTLTHKVNQLLTKEEREAMSMTNLTAALKRIEAALSIIAGKTNTPEPGSATAAEVTAAVTEAEAAAAAAEAVAAGNVAPGPVAV